MPDPAVLLQRRARQQNLSAGDHEIAVIYLGQCVERVPSKELFQNPLHSYTKALLSAIPIQHAEGSVKS